MDDSGGRRGILRFRRELLEKVGEVRAAGAEGGGLLLEARQDALLELVDGVLLEAELGGEPADGGLPGREPQEDRPALRGEASLGEDAPDEEPPEFGKRGEPVGDGVVLLGGRRAGGVVGGNLRESRRGVRARAAPCGGERRGATSGSLPSRGRSGPRGAS